MFCHDKEAAARERVKALLAIRPEIKYYDIAERAGVSFSTVKRVAVSMDHHRKPGPKKSCV